MIAGDDGGRISENLKKLKRCSENNFVRGHDRTFSFVEFSIPYSSNVSKEDLNSAEI